MPLKITSTAVDRRRGMTLAEVERFVAQARAAGAADDAPVRVHVTLRQTVKSLSIEAEATQPPGSAPSPGSTA